MKSTAMLPLALAAALAVACNSPRTGAPNETELQQSEGIGTAGDASGGAAASAEGDRDFAAKAAVGGMAEIELGQMAQQRAQSPDVKSFGEMMVRDHTSSSNELKQVASARNITLPTALDDEHRQLRDRLSGMRGADFDREYMNAMVDGHEKMIDLLESRSGAGNNDAAAGSLNQWASKTLPTVRHHLDEARRIVEGLDRNRTTQR